MPEDDDWQDTKPQPRERGRDAAAAARIEQQHTWVDQQIRQAIARGEFDDLPGAGKPIEDLGAEHDPDWWLKRLIEREHIVALPPSVEMRREDAALDGLLDQQSGEEQVRTLVLEFNARVRSARLHTEGPPFITQQRDVDTEVERWQERRRLRYDAEQHETEQNPPEARRRWWRR